MRTLAMPTARRLGLFILLVACTPLMIAAGGGPGGFVSGVAFQDFNRNGIRDSGEPGLIGWTIHVFDTATMALLQSTVTVAAHPLTPTLDGFYIFVPTPGSYTVCEALQAGWQQTAPLAVPPTAGETLAN